MALTLKSSRTTSNSPHRIPLGKGKFAIVDAADFAGLNQFKWSLRKSHSKAYAVRKVTIDGKRKIIFMHRQIMKPLQGMEVHHINHDPLDNRRSNLISLSHADHKYFHQVDRIRRLNPPPQDDLRHVHR